MAPKKVKKTEPVDEEDQKSEKEVQPAQRVLKVDMTESMRDEVLALVRDVFKKGYTSETEMANQIKTELTERYSSNADTEWSDAGIKSNWNCVVGRHFGTAITHEAGNFIYFYHGPTAVLLFKA